MNTLKDVRLLIIEDEPDFARLIKLSLAHGPNALFDVEIAHNLADAKRCIDATRCPCEPGVTLPRRFDVIVTDLCIPPHHGSETVRAVKEMADGIPVVVLTAQADTEIITDLVRAGAEDYLGKEEVIGSTGIVCLERALRHAIKQGRLREEMLRGRAYSQTLEQQIEMLQSALREKNCPI